jgi:tetratricopeptide (TPR) repeat protein
MKKILIILMALGTLTVSSCSDMLEEHPKAISIATFYNSPSEAHAAIIGLTGWLSNNQSWKGFNIYFQDGLSDMLYGRADFATFSDYTKLDALGQLYTSALWAYLYRCIRDANYAIRQFPKATSMTEEEKQSYLAQAKFFRAFSYFGLVRFWGGVPLRTEDNIGVDNVPRSSEEDIYNFILSDLDYVVKYIPESNTRGLPNRDAANYLLASVYMQLKQYDKALPLLKSIVSSNRYSLVSVRKANDFDNVFGPYAKETSEEVYYLKSEQGDVGGWGVPVYYNHPNAIVNGEKISKRAGYFVFYASDKSLMIKDWNRADLRRQYDLLPFDVGLGNGTYLISKFRDGDSSGDPGNDDPVVRYTDVLLLYAEAEARVNNGPNAEAMEAINEIHRRAYGKTPKSKSSIDYKLSNYPTLDSFLKLLVKEEGYETFGEGKRWLFLKRLGIEKEQIKEMKGIDIDSTCLLFPIHEKEYNVNHAIDPKKDQNPGY